METVVNPISVVLNVCVFYIVYKCPNPSMKLYTRVLLVSSAIDICLSVVVFLSQPVSPRPFWAAVKNALAAIPSKDDAP